MAYYNGDDYDDFTSDYGNDYEDSFSERYDRASGAPFGTFDINGDGDLDFLEKAVKLDHYQSLWDEEDQHLSAPGDYFLDDLIKEEEDDRFIKSKLSFNESASTEQVDICQEKVEPEHEDAEKLKDVADQKYHSYSFQSSEEIRMKELDERRLRDEKKYKEGYVEGNHSKAYNYFYGLEQMEKGTKEDFEAALKHLTFAIGYYPDIQGKIDYCKEEILRLGAVEIEKEKKANYEKALEYMNKKDYKKAMKIFMQLEGYENANEYYGLCKKGHEKNLLVSGLLGIAFVVICVLAMA